MIALNDSWERRGFTKDAEGFATDMICEINELDVERLDVNIAPRLVGGLVTLAHKISFQL
jgi:phage tail sheath gpL-like